jgi:hypothetical protein
MYLTKTLQEVVFTGNVTYLTFPGKETNNYCMFCDLFRSVADPGCLSRIPDPDFYPSRIPAARKERGEKIFFFITFYVATNFTKLQIILVLKC